MRGKEWEKEGSSKLWPRAGVRKGREKEKSNEQVVTGK